MKTVTAERMKRRPREWAERMLLPGVPNLHRVSDALYRSAQPSAAGMRGLKTMGIRTIVNLRSRHSDTKEIGRTRLRYEHVPLRALPGTPDAIIRFLGLVSGRRSSPVLVHCQFGADRTGVMCAVYRMVVEDWSVAEALEEMQSGEFGFRGIWDNLPGYLAGLDIARLRAAVAEADENKRKLWG